MRPPAAASTNSPSTNKPVRGSMSPCRRPSTLELHGLRRYLSAGDHLGQLGRAVLPYQEHGALGRVALVTDVGRHGGDVTSLHRHRGPFGAAVAVFDVPDNLVGEHHE